MMLYFRKYGDKLLFAIALAVLAGALIPFVRSGSSPEEKASGIVVFTQWWHGELEDDVLPGLIKEFEDLHGEIEIVLDTRPYEEIWQDFFNPEALPLWGDIFALDPLWVPELLINEIIENPSSTLLSFINVLYYNIEVLKEAGFSRPPGNRSEFLNYSRAITNENRRSLVMDTNILRGVYDDVYPWIWSAGAGLVRDGNPTVTAGPVVDSLSFLASLNNEGLILHSDGEKLEDFILGRAAFMIAPAGKINLVRKHMGDEAFGVTFIPSPDNYAGRTFFANLEWILAVNPASIHKEEAQLFVDFLVENAHLLSEKAGAAPSSRIQGIPDSFHSKVWEIAMAGESAQDFIGLPWVEMDSIFREELDALFAQTSTTAAAAAAIQRKWEAVLRKR